MLLFLLSCLDQEALRSQRKVQKNLGSSSGTVTSEIPSDPSVPFNGNIENSNPITDGFAHGRADLRHFVDPFDGTYKTKITVPKNLAGLLYISGINVSGLSERLIRVRFNFGREYEPIDIPATVGRAPGITPQTDIEVLILDMTTQPFNRIRLMYDLFDYKNYESSGSEVLDDSKLVTNPKNTNLFCRGLYLEHDPTFSDLGGDCDSSSDTCKYAYAKIGDSLLYDSQGFTSTPTMTQVGHSGGSYKDDSSSYDAKRCLPDNDKKSDLELVLTGTSISTATLGVLETITMRDGISRIYKGPFRLFNESGWEIKDEAIFSQKGIFRSYLGTTAMPEYGYRSLLFPRAGKMDLKKGTQYIGLEDKNLTSTERKIEELTASGSTGFMDGCNIRVSKHDSFTNEGISSCNVTATIELISLDPKTGVEQKILKVPNKTLKLQVIRPSLLDYTGREVLYEALKTCTNSRDCKNDECCFNQRCWSKRIVTQCREDIIDQGNLNVGESCGSDFQCSSLCCSGSTKVCAPHVNNFTDKYKVLCSKSPGQTCVAQDWCQKVDLRKCLIVKTGISVTGKQECGLRCYNVPTFADCRDGMCVPPRPFSVPAFDPLDPNRCNSAIDPPKNLNQLR